ncbi:hypothetical protein CgunFtcFv8_011009 [Champsocephalus gunnari]|uniref:Uncharacterized protein n=1 Tax=Champsocephalus gunnari TaxID=52237 RepID=A0AAN8DW53_CHAGU|nr:hypothetical protein CgunFtcFv8_011009 [Champsocephalus gunnari]
MTQQPHNRLSLWIQLLVNSMVTRLVRALSYIKRDLGCVSMKHNKEMSAQTEEETGLPCGVTDRQMVLERHKQGDESKEERRPVPGGCLASNTTLPKLDKEMKWALPSPRYNTINSL